MAHASTASRRGDGTPPTRSIAMREMCGVVLCCVAWWGDLCNTGGFGEVRRRRRWMDAAYSILAAAVGGSEIGVFTGRGREERENMQIRGQGRCRNTNRRVRGANAKDNVRYGYRNVIATP